MPTRSNEQLCRMAQKGDTAARDILLEKNLGFIRKIALEQYRNMGLDENDIGIDLDDLMQEGSIGLLNAIPLFDAGRGMKFLTYAAPALRNAMTDCIRAALGLFEQRMVAVYLSNGWWIRKTAPASREYIWMTFSQRMNGCCESRPLLTQHPKRRSKSISKKNS